MQQCGIGGMLQHNCGNGTTLKDGLHTHAYMHTQTQMHTCINSHMAERTERF